MHLLTALPYLFAVFIVAKASTKCEFKGMKYEDGEEFLSEDKRFVHRCQIVGYNWAAPIVACLFENNIRVKILDFYKDDKRKYLYTCYKVGESGASYREVPL